MSVVKRSMFNGKEYLDLIQQGKQMIVDKVIFITKHKGITSTADSSLAGHVTIYGIPHHGEDADTVVLIDAQRFNLPSVAGEWCSTVIDAQGWSDNYEGLVIDIDWRGHLQDVGTEAIKFRSVKSIMTEASNNT